MPTQIFTSVDSFTLPLGVTRLDKVEVWGQGGARAGYGGDYWRVENYFPTGPIVYINRGSGYTYVEDGFGTFVQASDGGSDNNVGAQSGLGDVSFLGGASSTDAGGGGAGSNGNGGDATSSGGVGGDPDGGAGGDPYLDGQAPAGGAGIGNGTDPDPLPGGWQVIITWTDPYEESLTSLLNFSLTILTQETGSGATFLSLVTFVAATKVTSQSLISTLTLSGAGVRNVFGTASSALAFLGSSLPTKLTLAGNEICLDVNVVGKIVATRSVTSNLNISINVSDYISNRLSLKEYNLSRRKMTVQNNTILELVTNLNLQTNVSTPRSSDEVDLNFQVTVIGTVDRCQN